MLVETNSSFFYKIQHLFDVHATVEISTSTVSKCFLAKLFC